MASKRVALSIISYLPIKQRGNLAAYLQGMYLPEINELLSIT